MSTIKPDRLGEVEQAAVEAIEQAQAQANAAAANEFEGEVREFVRRDASFRQRRPQGGADGAAENLNSLIQRVSTASTDEIERVIAELQALRDQLRAESERVQREISNYAGMSQAAMSSMRVIGDSLRQLKAPAAPVPAPAPVPPIQHQAG